ncbi:DUF3243 domain-containing protein [Paenibacillus campi]|uniref:DUF3243 domain-containing protein n=1 Tax=Paenibacillus campi TaxID=3106031 RepID=UPI002AFEBA22|nr:MULTISPECIES: DUF3243 domain-containing protein [unclassified Paenibacillus]
MTEQPHIVNKSGEVATDKVEPVIDRMSDERKKQILDDFEHFRSYLGKRIHMAESIGLGEESIAKVAQKIADYLAKHEEPQNNEEQLLYELWKVGDEEERHKLAHLLVKMVKSNENK